MAALGAGGDSAKSCVAPSALNLHSLTHFQAAANSNPSRKFVLDYVKMGLWQTKLH